MVTLLKTITSGVKVFQFKSHKYHSHRKMLRCISVFQPTFAYNFNIFDGRFHGRFFLVFGRFSDFEKGKET